MDAELSYAAGGSNQPSRKTATTRLDGGPDRSNQ